MFSGLFYWENLVFPCNNTLNDTNRYTKVAKSNTCMNKVRTAMGRLGVALVLVLTAIGCNSDDYVFAEPEIVEFNAFNAIN